MSTFSLRCLCRLQKSLSVSLILSFILRDAFKVSILGVATLQCVCRAFPVDQGSQHGLLTPNEAFFSLKSQTLGHLGYFLSNYQHPFWYCESLVTVFHYSTIISTQNNKPLPFDIHIPNIYLGLGFEFESQRIRVLSFVCP